MRAQFAVSEAFLSMMLLAAALSMTANSVYTTYKLQADYRTGYGDSIYDYSMLLSHNQSASVCVSSGNAVCIKQLAAAIANVYGLEYVRIDSGNADVSYGTNATCTRKESLCSPQLSGSNYSVSCIHICGD
ncbi:MAG: hypothetical protein KGH60_04225 [Candidatus Micrarchaeota archaeon]|nr:hypothetical protein [Candidatus Micrarchaeota archaeon]